MKIFKLVISFCITGTLIYLLNNSWVISGNRLPPLGKFLDPFHGFWKNIEKENHQEPGTVSVAGLKKPVKIIYDSLLMPHIFAGNDEDLYLAQGYVTAALRLWQMEFQTHAAAGRVSEIIGAGKNDAILNYDRNQRRFGMTFGTEHAVEKMMSDPLSRMMIEKYSEGVNQYIQSLDYDHFPFEYKLLDYAPEPWTSFKVGLLLQTMAQSLNMSDKDMEMTNALKLFGKEMVDLLYPDRENVGDPIVDNPGNWNFKAITIDSVPPALPEELINIKKNPGSNPNNGSNNWALSGKKTATGAPMLCNDPHLNLSLPSIWFALQLHGPGVNTMGVSLPGSPGIIIGFNDSIAWGMTNAQRDLIDWYRIKYKDNSRNEYLLDGKWAKTKKVVEKIKVRGQPAFYDTVVYTKWGPVTYDRNYRPEKNLRDYAFRWIAHDASNELIALHKLNRAESHHDFMAALDLFELPAQNFAFASVAGDIAMRIQGKFPVRRKAEGKFVLDGAVSSNGWQAFIPNEQNIMIKNPDRGFVSSANQYPVDETYPYYITARSFEAYRNRRINKILAEKNNLNVKDMMKLQNDTYNLKAEESLPTFLSYIDTTHLKKEEQQAYDILKSWNYNDDIDSEGAAYYEAWWDNLVPLLWDELIDEQRSLAIPTTFNTIKLIKENPQLSFFDIKDTNETETAGDVIQVAFHAAVKDIEQWKKSHQTNHVKWADYKDGFIQHLLRIEPLNIHVRHGGNHDIVNAFSRSHGPSWRMIVSLEKSGVKAWATYPGGQSGNPGSKHFSDLLVRWVKGEYFKLSFLHTPGITNALYETQLTPLICD